MSQHDYNIANGGGAAVRADLNNALQAILSQNSGATAPTTTKPFMLWYDTANGLIKMRNAADNAWLDYMNSSGQLVAPTATGLITALGGQIKFPATQVASADANTLDDYEEGTWTPTFTGATTNPTVTYTKQEGRYVKVGKMVLVQFDLRWSSKSGGSGTVQISGLPFSTDGGYNYGVVSEKQNVNMDAGYTYLVAELPGSNTVIFLVQSNATSSGASLGTGNIGTGGYVIGGASYISAN